MPSPEGSPQFASNQAVMSGAAGVPAGEARGEPNALRFDVSGQPRRRKLFRP